MICTKTEILVFSILDASPIPRRKQEWTKLDDTAVSRRSVTQIRVNSVHFGPYSKIRLKEPRLNERLPLATSNRQEQMLHFDLEGFVDREVSCIYFELQCTYVNIDFLIFFSLFLPFRSNTSICCWVFSYELLTSCLNSIKD